MFQSIPSGAMGLTGVFIRVGSWLFLSSALVLAQPRQDNSPTLPQAFTVDAWSSDHGLPQNSIQAIGQTLDGYLWLATQGGLIRFDGQTFVTYNQTNTPALQQDWINALTVTRDGTIWIGVSSYGLLSMSNGQFTQHLEAIGMGNIGIVALCEDSSGRIWAGTRASGIVRIDHGTASRVRASDGIPSDDIRALFTDRSGTVWVGTNRGLACQTTDGWRVYSRKNGLPDDMVESIGQDGSGAMLIGTRMGLAVLNNGTMSVVPRFAQQRILSLHSGSGDQLLVGMYAGGLYSWNGSNLESMTLMKGESPSVTSLYRDKEGSLWIGTNGFGLFRLRRSRAVGLTAPTRLSSSSIWSLSEDSEGAIWVGTDGNGVDRLVKGSRTNYTTANGLPSNTVYAVCEDKEGTIWMSTERELARYRNGRIEVVRPSGPHTLEGSQSLYVDRKGTLWVGVVGKVIGCYTKGQWTFLTADNGLPKNFGTCFWEDGSGTMWIGTDGGGVVAFVNGKIVVHTKEHGLSTESINCFYEDTRGNMWVGTYGGGLSRFADGQWTSVTVRNGLAEDIVFSIQRDDFGMVWLSGNVGVFRVSEQELIACASGTISAVHGLLVNNFDGMPSRECCGGVQPASWKARNGLLWYPTVRGVAVIDPKAIQPNLLAPPVVIQEIRAERTAVSLQPSLVLGPGVRDLEFTYAGLSFLDPVNIRFRYRLDGYDTDWIDAGNRRVAFYTGLLPGLYAFRVQAANRDGVWNEEGVSVVVTLKPMWYQSWWFYVLCGLGVLLSGYGLYRYRIRQLLEHEQELQRRVDEALINVKVLGGLIPICANCKKIRDDKGYWNNLERYIHDHSEATFSHSLCPECMEKLYGSFLKKDSIKTPEAGKKN